MRKTGIYLTTFILSLLCNAAWAQEKDTRIYMDDFSMSAGEEQELMVKFEGNVYITQAQFTIILPEGFEFVNKGTERRPVYARNTANSAGLTLSSNLIGQKLNVTLLDGQQIGTEEQNGDLAVVYIRASEPLTAGQYELQMSRVVASDENAARYPTDDAIVTATILPAVITVTLPDDGICTYSCPKPLDLPSTQGNITAYYAKSYNGESVGLEKVCRSIVAGEGLILAGEPNGSIELNEATDQPQVIEDNMLKGTAFAPYTVETSDVYVLANKTGEAKFHRAAVGLTIPREKAYLELDYPSQANALRIIWDESTLVEMIKANMPNVSTPSFDLLGRPTKDGSKGKKAISVRKGKKTVMK